MAVKIRSVIIPETINRKMNRASTLPAVIEARSGHNGKLSNIFFSGSQKFEFRMQNEQGGEIFLHAGFIVLTPSYMTPVPAARCCFFQAEEDQDHSAEQKNCQHSTDFQHVGHDRAVFSGGGVVVIAVKENLIDG